MNGIAAALWRMLLLAGHWYCLCKVSALTREIYEEISVEMESYDLLNGDMCWYLVVYFIALWDLPTRDCSGMSGQHIATLNLKEK